MVPNRGIYQVGLALYAGLALVALAFGYWQVIAAPELLRRPENSRPLDLLLRSPRGAILDRNGVVLARSAAGPDGIYRREYPVPEAAPVVGYFNPSLGRAGVEAVANDTLQQVRWPQWPWTLQAGVAARDVRLTLDANLQAQIFRLFGGRPGAAVVMTPDGAVLALVSSPTFDPNRLAAGQPQEAALGYLRTLQADGGAPLLNRATQGQYAPGSTFKTVTLAAALELGAVRPDEAFEYQLNPQDASHPVPWHTNGFVNCGNIYLLASGNRVRLDLAHAYAWSCNVTHANLALRLGAPALLDYARRFGFEAPIPFELPVVPSRLQQRPDFFTGPEAQYALASTGIGQGELLVTPLQMALVAAAVAADGKVPRPRLLADRPAETWRQAIGPDVARQLRTFMTVSVAEGWARPARVSGVTVAGKTGTAEAVPGRPAHSWFIGFAPAENPRVVVALVVEEGGASTQVAAPLASQVLRAALAAVK
ncbi:MAG: hypothetical protein C4315_00600 [Chloroflexota bacterium]